MPLHINTPLFRSQSISHVSGLDVWVKLEASQPTGSFKLRGVGHACEQHARLGKKSFISSFGANTSVAVAYSGRQLGIPVTIFCPTTITPHTRYLIEIEGATIVEHGNTWKEAS